MKHSQNEFRILVEVFELFLSLFQKRNWNLVDRIPLDLKEI
ncbi:hypothetical protein [Leptospira interrogans]|uniref:Uncharacterized protein n=3 Tax=Leptospira interrogans TaxID=173 RepID=A0A0E2D049_LEPIR|nr:hypothetical protein [Leptospira interrogans]EJP14060.1 hypothetical protein LEP1GSC080_1812 [Leptospira interrogans str. FPW2026]EKR53226.1 hypothetical protein LEP1GSC105_1807 [Leptospira interrogans str. UI 12758]EKO23751.1 hypothetical protein LEP1GSC104_2298 [Leptospira interrogans str. UI 12621]EMJ57035.1 hypothetical protein LEP1GSC111_1965 [Leptospira interrogans str. UT126]EMN84199.1 hypothetical protein LEP1GSC107_1628 [Leptospira interrogans serovar Grippotyphosa str. UI 12769]